MPELLQDILRDTGDLDVGVIPRSNRWFANDSGESASSTPDTASPRLLRPL
jgi:hypothetical protein